MAKGRKNSLWFAFNDITSTDMGLRVTWLPDVQIAEARGKAVEIPGRDGDLWLADNSFKPVTMRIEFEIGSTANTNAITAWLTGSGSLILSNFSDYYWKARIVKPFNLNNGIFLAGHFRTTVEFVCQPFRYLLDEDEVTITVPADPDEHRFDDHFFDGLGTWTAKPIITVTGSGTFNVIVNGLTILFDDVDEYITLDCDAMMAYKGSTNESSKVTILSDEDEWPLLHPGTAANRVNWSLVTGETGDITQIVFQPNWRWR